jgi:hypothetical protein
MDYLNTPAPSRLVAWSLGRLVAWVVAGDEWDGVGDRGGVAQSGDAD